MVKQKHKMNQTNRQKSKQKRAINRAYKREQREHRLNTYKVRKPSKLLYRFADNILVKRYSTSKNTNIRYNFDVKNLKPPFIVLFAHPSIRDFIYVIDAMRPHIVSSVISRWFFHDFFLRLFLPKLGGIPKRLFTNEPNVVKNIMTVMKNNGIVTLSPEGINTLNGESLSLIPSTAKLIKKLKVPVISVNINGAYLTVPNYNYDAKNVGRVDVIVDMMFTTEELEQKSNDELLDEMTQKLYYNDFEWARENNIEFKAENRTFGLNNLLYICPKCKSQYKMEEADNKIWCSECGFGAFVDTRFQLNKLRDDDELPTDISQWFNIQDNIIKNEIAAPDFEIREKCVVKNFSKYGARLIPRYDGEMVINNTGVRFIGVDVKTGSKEELFIEIEKFPRVSNTVNKGIYFYVNDVCCEFEFKNGAKTIQCTQAIYHLHNLKNEINNKEIE